MESLENLYALIEKNAESALLMADRTLYLHGRGHSRTEDTFEKDFDRESYGNLKSLVENLEKTLTMEEDVFEFRGVTLTAPRIHAVMLNMDRLSGILKGNVKGILSAWTKEYTGF